MASRIERNGLTKEPTVAERAIRRTRWCIVPFMFLMYFFNTMDRSNISFAALRMGESMRMTSVDFANMISVFFITYLVFQIPSNIVIEKLGPRRWIGTIVAGWGLATMAMFFVTSINQAMAARLLLGVFEAGFFPGLIYYIALWFPGSERGKVVSWFMLAAAASAVVAGPVSGWIVEHFHHAGYEGWRWLFLIEGVPTVLCGVAAFFLLSNSPSEAPWLREDERAWLVATLAAERARITPTQQSGVLEVLKNPVLWMLAIVYMCVQGASQSSMMWLPRMIKGYGFGLADSQIGLVVAIPFLCGLLTMTLWGYSSDRTGDRKWHAIASFLTQAVGFIMLVFLPSLPLKMVALAVYGVGTFGYMGPYWPMPAAMLPPAALAVSIAFINSASSLGGFLAAKILGYVEAYAGNDGLCLALTAMGLVSVFVLMSMKVPRERPVSRR